MSDQTLEPPYPHSPESVELEEIVVSVDEVDDDDSGADSTQSPPKSSPWRERLIVAALTAVVSIGAVLGYGQFSSSDEEQVRSVAHRAATNLINFDYRTIDADVKEISSDATGSFAEQFSKAIGGSEAVFREAIKKAQGISTGTVAYVTVGDVTKERAFAVASVTQKVTNVESPEPISQDRWMQFQLIHTTSGWKVEEIKMLVSGDLQSGQAPEATS